MSSPKHLVHKASVLCGLPVVIHYNVDLTPFLPPSCFSLLLYYSSSHLLNKDDNDDDDYLKGAGGGGGVGGKDYRKVKGAKDNALNLQLSICF